jgi:hypothetical protein
MARFPTDTIWTLNTVYLAGAWIVPTIGNGYFYQAENAGSSGATQPTFGTTVNGFTTDGTVHWRCLLTPEVYDIDRYSDDWPLTESRFGKGYFQRVTQGFKPRYWKMTLALIGPQIATFMTFRDNCKGSVVSFSVYVPLLATTVTMCFVKDWIPEYVPVVAGNYTAVTVEVLLEEAF